MTIKIFSDFESASIDILACDSPDNIWLALKSDNRSDNRQWFYFKLEGHVGTSVRVRIEDILESSFPDGWKEYRVLASYDQNEWFRLSTTIENSDLMIQFMLEQSEIYLAYYVPYSITRAEQLRHKILQSERVEIFTIGRSILERNIELFRIGSPDERKKKIWMVARQHPGETMAQWCIEGVLEALAEGESFSQRLLDDAVIYVVADMNPDGGALGNHRTNAAGMDLNRQWGLQDQSASPEVQAVQEMMAETGVDVFIDVHGDESIPFVFMMGSDGCGRLKAQANNFKSLLQSVNTDFQTLYDYGNLPGENSACAAESAGKVACCCTGNAATTASTKARDYVEKQYRCLSLLLEIPFLEIAGASADSGTWPVEGVKGLGSSLVHALALYLESD